MSAEKNGRGAAPSIYMEMAREAALRHSRRCDAVLEEMLRDVGFGERFTLENVRVFLDKKGWYVEKFCEEGGYVSFRLLRPDVDGGRICKTVY